MRSVDFEGEGRVLIQNVDTVMIMTLVLSCVYDDYDGNVLMCVWRWLQRELIEHSYPPFEHVLIVSRARLTNEKLIENKSQIVSVTDGVGCYDYRHIKYERTDWTYVYPSFDVIWSESEVGATFSLEG